jgi:hypothetical protein
VPATVRVVRLTGSGPSETDITSQVSVVNAEDSPSSTPSTNPTRIPLAGENRSYWVTTRLKATVTPASIVNNLKWFTDGVNGLGTGFGCKVAVASSYVIASGTQGVSGTQLSTANHAGIAQEPVDAFAFTIDTPLSVPGSISNPSVGQFGSFVVFQVSVGPTATPGVSSEEQFIWSYDEV